MKIELVSLEECVNFGVGSEDEMIDLIDSKSDKGLWSHRADLENWMDDYLD